jgi:hypothetical protein
MTAKTIKAEEEEYEEEAVEQRQSHEHVML